MARSILARASSELPPIWLDRLSSRQRDSLIKQDSIENDLLKGSTATSPSLILRESFLLLCRGGKNIQGGKFKSHYMYRYQVDLPACWLGDTEIPLIWLNFTFVFWHPDKSHRYGRSTGSTYREALIFSSPLHSELYKSSFQSFRP